MKGKIHRKFIAGVTVLSMALVGAGQAQADRYDTERAIAAILGLAVVGAIIAKENKKDRAKRHAARQEDDLRARPLPQRASRKLLPGRCLRSFGQDRPLRMFPKRCLHRRYGATDHLPLRCERRVRTDRGIREGFAARCLRRYGYEVAQR